MGHEGVLPSAAKPQAPAGAASGVRGRSPCRLARAKRGGASAALSRRRGVLVFSLSSYLVLPSLKILGGGSRDLSYSHVRGGAQKGLKRGSKGARSKFKQSFVYADISTFRGSKGAHREPLLSP
jgi:hypothetical protein